MDPATTHFASRKLHLGYRQARLLSGGATLRGHEFHYATLIDPGRDERLADLFDGEGRSLGKAGGQRGYVSGSFFHVIARQDFSDTPASANVAIPT